MQKPFIIIKGQPRALQIDDIKQESNGAYAVRFANRDTVYHYASRDVVVLTDTRYYNPADCHVYVDGKHKRNIAEITAFPQGGHTHWRITYENGFVRDFLYGKGIEVKVSCLADKHARNVFEYLKAIAAVNTLGKDQETLGILTSLYSNISFIDNTLAIAPYLFPAKIQVGKLSSPSLIYPFGCNASQKKAVTAAFANQISVIQGPHGTGKTQTILNIIANIIMQGKTVLVVSNNNSATANVKEKLENYGLDFIAAPLGRHEHKEEFIHHQPTAPSALRDWQADGKTRLETRRTVGHTLNQLGKVFQRQEQLAMLRLELQSLKLEWEHFRTNHDADDETPSPLSMNAAGIMALWLECQAIADGSGQEEKRGMAGLIERIRWWWKRRKIKRLLHVSEVDKGNLWPIITELQNSYYQKRLTEVTDGIEGAENYLSEVNAQGMAQSLAEASMLLLKDALCQRYKDAQPLAIQETKEIRTKAKEFCSRYPVVLSTTFSARTSVPGYVYDYIVMDEASQVSVETGCLALACARNAVIVGDTMQLPNVVTEDDKSRLNDIYDYYKVDEGYNSAENSFLESVCKVVPGVTQTLLREHYRCHPRIINFCNQKYYGGQLLIMTEDHDEQDVVSAIKTVPGHHARGHYNQREIDVIRQEVLPSLPANTDVGIISPYNSQVDAINSQLGDIAATVHKYQGREKDTVIFSVVDDEITGFSDDPNLLNVAISRAKKNFCLVVTGNRQEKKGNITDLVDYIEYNSCSVTESKIHSIFDYLYGAYTEERMKLLAGSDKVSEYDTENLMYALINKILREHGEFADLGVLCHYPMRLLIRDTSAMTDEERLYASHPWTHVDFLIYSHVTKRPVLVIETDGYSYHNERTAQHKRDKLKDNILKKYGIHFLRLSTIESGEEKKIITELKRQ